MWLVFCPVFDPLNEDGFFSIAQTEVRLGRGHEVFGVIGNDAVEDFTAAQTAFGDGYFARAFFQLGVGSFGQVEAQSGFLFGLVGSVAGKTLVGKDGLDVEVVVQLSGQACKFCLQFRR